MDILGVKGRQEIFVTEEMSAKSMGSGELMVFATPAMLSLVEKTAWMSISDHLEEGETTVGTMVNLSHVSATPLGRKVWCETEVTEVDRKKIVFKFDVFDDAGEIGRGEHERFVVDSSKFMKKAESK